MIKSILYESLTEAATIDYDEYTKNMNLPFKNSKPDVVFDLALRNILKKSINYNIELIPVHITSREFYLCYDKLDTKNIYSIMNFNSYKNSYFPKYSKELNKKFNSDIINAPYLFDEEELGINYNFNEKMIMEILKNYSGDLNDINHYCVVTYYFNKSNQLSHLKNYLFDRNSDTFLIENWLDDNELKPSSIIANMYEENYITNKLEPKLSLKASSIKRLRNKNIMEHTDLKLKKSDDKKEKNNE